MAYNANNLFPERIAMGARGGPGFDTEIVALAGGLESANSAWPYPRQRWDVGWGIRTQADFEACRAHFIVARGKAGKWPFKDWTDYQTTHADGVVTQLTGTTYQLFKRYTSGGVAVDRKLRKPVSGSTEVKVSGVVTAHVLDAATGIITIASGPAPGDVTVACEFYTPMRYDTDQLDAVAIARRLQDGLLHQWSGIPILEVDPD